MLEEQILQQIQLLNEELATALPGSPQALVYEQQIAVLQNELAEQPVVPPIFPHFFPGPHVGPGPHRGR